MNYIVFDLEWNQNPSGKKTRNDQNETERMPSSLIIKRKNTKNKRM